MMSEIFSNDGIWIIISAILLPTMVATWWYMLNKTSHLYSKIAQHEATLAERGAYMEFATRQFEIMIEDIDQLKSATSQMQTEINYLYWDLYKEMTNENKQGVKAKRPANRQSLRRPEQS